MRSATFAYGSRTPQLSGGNSHVAR
jgi:hypothetical protein